MENLIGRINLIQPRAFGAMAGRRFPPSLAAVILCLLSVGSSDIASDRAECETQLLGLATCLTYVQGGAGDPTPDCCAGLKQVVAKSFKCVCVLIKDRDDPSLGIKVNATRTLTLPSKCEATANVSDCPRLLGLPPNSNQTQVFEQFGRQLEGNGTRGSVTGTSKGISNSGGRSKRWLGMEMGCRVWMLSLLPLTLLLLGS